MLRQKILRINTNDHGKKNTNDRITPSVIYFVAVEFSPKIAFAVGPLQITI